MEWANNQQHSSLQSTAEGYKSLEPHCTWSHSMSTIYGKCLHTGFIWSWRAVVLYDMTWINEYMDFISLYSEYVTHVTHYWKKYTSMDTSTHVVNDLIFKFLCFPLICMFYCTTCIPNFKTAVPHSMPVVHKFLHWKLLHAKKYEEPSLNQVHLVREYYIVDI